MIIFGWRDDIRGESGSEAKGIGDKVMVFWNAERCYLIDVVGGIAYYVECVTRICKKIWNFRPPFAYIQGDMDLREVATFSDFCQFSAFEDIDYLVCEEWREKFSKLRR